jgi:poly(3-hydroxybutyrate) depolymerase
MPGEVRRTVMIQGVERSYIVDAPAVVDPEHELALAFVFHGNGGSGQGIQSMGLQQVDGAQDQALFVFPDGLPYMDFGVGWNGTCDEYDMEFFDEMVESLSQEYCIDPARIFAAGFSWGGDMCESLACCRGEVVRGIAPASGPEFYPFDCADTDRPAVRMTYATNDAYSPELFAQTREFYRNAHGCSDTPMPVSPEPCITFADCAKPLISCEYEGLGHAWPGDWATETWAFFSQF